MSSENTPPPVLPPVRELSILVREDVRVAADAVKGQVQADAARVRRAVRLLGHGMVAGVLATHLLATAVLSWVVLSYPVPHPEMYPLMGLVLGLVLTTRFTALLGGRRAAAARGMVLNLLLHAFWLAVLVDQVPARMIVADEVVERAPLLWLAVPIALYLLALGGMIAHGFVWRRHLRLASEAGGEA